MGKRTSVQICFAYGDDKIGIWDVDTVLGSSWAIGATDAEDEVPWLHWKHELGDLEDAKEYGWKKYGYPEVPTKPVEELKKVERPKKYKPIQANTPKDMPSEPEPERTIDRRRR